MYTARMSVPVKEFFVTFPIMNTPRVPDDLQSERRVFRPRFSKHTIDGRSVHMDRQALKRVQCTRKRRAKCRRTVFGELVVCDRLQRVHEGTLGHGCAD